MLIVCTVVSAETWACTGDLTKGNAIDETRACTGDLTKGNAIAETQACTGDLTMVMKHGRVLET